MLQEGFEASPLDPEALSKRLQQELQGVASRLLNWSASEREFLDRLHDEGEVDATLLHHAPDVQERIMTQPMLLWKAQNVRQHRRLDS